MLRRTFFGAFGASAAAPYLPAFAQERPNGNPKIASLEFSQLSGRRETEKGSRPYTALYLKIRTDSALEGLYGPIDDEAAIIVDRQLRRVVQGRDALAVESIWEAMYRSNRHARTGQFMMAISAVDNTLWDLRGRYFGVPVYRLLGGPTRPAIETYASCLGDSLEPERLAARARQVRDQGYRYQKWFFATGPGEGPEGLARSVEVVRNLREALGEAGEFMLDASRRWDLNYALTWAKQAEKYRPGWIEEAFFPDHPASFAELRRATTIPIAAGEHIYARWEAHDYLKADALNVLQSDPEWCGGITELVKVCAIASAYDVQVIPHGHSMHAALHVIAAQSPRTCPLAEYLIQKMSYYYHFEKNPPRPESGHFKLPERPGFGIELDPAKVEKQAPVHW